MIVAPSSFSVKISTCVLHNDRVTFKKFEGKLWKNFYLELRPDQGLLTKKKFVKKVLGRKKTVDNG